MKNEATVMVSGESVSLCTSTLMFVLSSSPSSLTLHVSLYDFNSPNFVSWSLGPGTHHRPALCPVRTDAKRADRSFKEIFNKKIVRFSHYLWRESLHLACGWLAPVTWPTSAPPPTQRMQSYSNKQKDMIEKRVNLRNCICSHGPCWVRMGWVVPFLNCP